MKVISGEDAHNTIVKETAEKVLSSLQPHQIPGAVKSIKQFLSSSQPKMTELVEGYVSNLFEAYFAVVTTEIQVECCEFYKFRRCFQAQQDMISVLMGIPRKGNRVFSRLLILME
ncbi:hypothetical protein POTOM_016868 [Populus tomentosa]|uniref:Uncharacterized protein n=1 Tax=Populus tomentosa TaxID=118781 RepID=A0A8X7ZTI5_POPTO|nr:hypothetical protein POTOM_016868 [Populus tomentosa]